MKRILIFFILVVLGTAAFAAEGTAKLPFIQDNYQAALEQAKNRKQPIFVECWAPW